MPARAPVAGEPCVEQVILKIAQRCNLNCTYCYVYNRGDESWRSRPAIISLRVATRLAERIAEHCDRHGLEAFTVEFHGGEPLLVGTRRLQALLDILRERSGVRLRFVLQTNGTLLDQEWIELFARNDVSFGLSLDGPPELADTRRIYRRGGGGTTGHVLRKLDALRAAGSTFDEVFGGCLCVINAESNGGALVDWFADNGFASVDFLLPDGNYSNFPQDWRGVAPYRDFLLSAFDRWYSLGERAPRIRKFELMMLGLLGGTVRLDALGGDLRRLCVVESDGSIGVNDVARICGGDLAHDQLTIFTHRLDEHVQGYGILELQALCTQCQSCPYLAACGGGYLPHRFDGVAFDNPSLYCDALYALSERMARALVDDLPAAFWRTPSSALDQPRASVTSG
jgi:uncharacterized protein